MFMCINDLPNTGHRLFLCVCLGCCLFRFLLLFVGGGGGGGREQKIFCNRTVQDIVVIGRGVGQYCLQEKLITKSNTFHLFG